MHSALSRGHWWKPGIENATDSFVEIQNTAEELQHAKNDNSKQVLTKRTEKSIVSFRFRLLIFASVIISGYRYSELKLISFISLELTIKISFK